MWWLRLREWIVTYFFEKDFRFFKYPFESVDYLISKLPKDEQEQYVETIKRWYNSKAFQMENTEMKKLFYKELSISTTNEISRSAYRLCLLYIRKIERRYDYLIKSNALDQHTKSFNKK
jgi:hypothetical protein